MRLEREELNDEWIDLLVIFGTFSLFKVKNAENLANFPKIAHFWIELFQTRIGSDKYDIMMC